MNPDTVPPATDSASNEEPETSKRSLVAGIVLSGVILSALFLPDSSRKIGHGGEAMMDIHQATTQYRQAIAACLTTDDQHALQALIEASGKAGERYDARGSLLSEDEKRETDREFALLNDITTDIVSAAEPQTPDTEQFLSRMKDGQKHGQNHGVTAPLRTP